MNRDLYITVHRLGRSSPGGAFDLNPLAVATMSADSRGHAVVNMIGGLQSHTLQETPAQVKALIRGEAPDEDDSDDLTPPAKAEAGDAKGDEAEKGDTAEQADKPPGAAGRPPAPAKPTPAAAKA